MGLPAPILHPVRATGARLRVVSTSGPKRGAPGSSARSGQRSQQVFSMACALLVVVSAFGVGRVMLASKAAESSIVAGRLSEDIKAERLVGDLLEADKSALTTPARIEGIAGETMQMAEAPSVNYLTISSDSAPPAPVPVAPVAQPVVESSAVSERTTGDGFAEMVSSVMEMASGEAQVLLVGDVGLASSE